MWIVRFALRRPFSVLAFCTLIVMLSVLSVVRMPVDLLPAIDLPAVGIFWNYTGLAPEEMERRIVIINERYISATVDSIDRIESVSSSGIGLIRVYFQPGADMGLALAQLTSVCAASIRYFPQGTTLPTILPLNASSIPVAQLTLSSETLTESEIYDFTNNFLRVKIFSIPGISVPVTYGGKSRLINVNVDPKKLAANNLSAADISNVIQNMNITLPSGSARIGDMDFAVSMNSSPSSIEQFNQIPIRSANGSSLLLGDVSRVFDGSSVQTNIVRVNGQRASYLNILKKGGSSTISVIDAIKKVLPSLREYAPKGMNINLDFDQSQFVRAAIVKILEEGVLSSALVSIMILVFLRSWRSVIIVCTSIPMAIMFALVGLKLAGQSINIMTLGGLSLAIGMLVDDATVEVENIHRNRALGHSLTVSILKGAEQVALPAIIATFSICIVFAPVIFLSEPAHSLFVPLALSVVFSMTASYVLSRTLVPLLSRKLLAGEDAHAGAEANGRIFQFIQTLYGGLIEDVLRFRFLSGLAFVCFIGMSLTLVKTIGLDFFPTTDTGLLKLHMRSAAGSRIEETENLTAHAENAIREIIPEQELETITATVGVPNSYNPLMVQTENVSGMDSELLVSLKPGHHPTEGYIKRIRSEFQKRFVSATVQFMPADLVSQVLTFGASSTLDIQLEGADFGKLLGYAQKLKSEIRTIPGVVDLGLKQVLDYPTLRFNVDRIKASAVGLSQKDAANTLLISLSNSSLLAPSWFLNPTNAVTYSVVVQTPPVQIFSVQDILSLPITPASPSNESRGPSSLSTVPQHLRDIAEVKQTTSMGTISHSNVQRTLNLTGGIEGRDLGGVVNDVKSMISSLGTLESGVKISVRGQYPVMEESFSRMGLGLIVSTLLVYILMMVLYQSFLDPLIAMSAIPAALAGVLWMLAMTHTTINVQSIMGAIMAIGISTSNSILVVSFANEWRVENGGSALDAALAAGRARLRPVLMTAMAMIIGMAPAALGLGEGGEQMAPLGRAVIGGLLIATFATLFFVPITYSFLRRRPPDRHLLEQQLNQEEREGLA